MTRYDHRKQEGEGTVKGEVMKKNNEGREYEGGNSGLKELTN